ELVHQIAVVTPVLPLDPNPLAKGLTSTKVTVRPLVPPPLITQGVETNDQLKVEFKATGVCPLVVPPPAPPHPHGHLLPHGPPPQPQMPPPQPQMPPPQPLPVPQPVPQSPRPQLAPAPSPRPAGSPTVPPADQP
ncbi:MAG TPA: hypothetical protein VH092_08730, partial [Urbifossiella sp.]|nr:hypothetical protein [Urbifossiella sp.]